MQKSFLINCIDTYFTGKIKCPNLYVEDLQCAFQLHNLIKICVDEEYIYSLLYTSLCFSL